jgi:hypothetical protein
VRQGNDFPTTYRVFTRASMRGTSCRKSELCGADTLACDRRYAETQSPKTQRWSDGYPLASAIAHNQLRRLHNRRLCDAARADLEVGMLFRGLIVVYDEYRRWGPPSRGTARENRATFGANGSYQCYW